MKQLRELYQELATGNSDDHAAFIESLMDPARESEARELLLSIAQQEALPGDHHLSEEQQETLASGILAAVRHLETAPAAATPTPVHRVHFLRRRGWAAAILILGLGVGTWAWLHRPPAAPAGLATQQEEVIQPGGNKATLTLADGRHIVLDDIANGTIASQGNASIVKLANGQLVYNLQNLPAQTMMMNTMTTPRGGQYQLTLPDGTQVWLNAASSITYPAAFTGRERKVEVTGEVYFEVAPDKSMPFIVGTADQLSVEVLGTQFNINSYGDEGAIETTLLQGSIRITKAAGDRQPASVLLQPEQQARAAINSTAAPSLEVIKDINTDKIMAWKNGLFYFEEASLPLVMKQLERWYNIDVQYKGAIPLFNINGRMDRGLNLQDLLVFLSKMGAKCHLEGRTLIVDEA